MEISKEDQGAKHQLGDLHNLRYQLYLWKTTTQISTQNKTKTKDKVLRRTRTQHLRPNATLPNYALQNADTRSRPQSRTQNMFCYLAFRCYFQANGQNYIHFWLIQLLKNSMA